MIPGIKVDEGAKPLAGCPGETVTEGLDGLRERLVDYHALGARFAKWRAVIDIADGIPSWSAINANAHALARYAALCQENGIVPIVEPEVLMDGAHSLERCEEVTALVLETVFHQLFSRARHARGHGAQAQHGDLGQEGRQPRRAAGGGRGHPAGAAAPRAARGPRHRLPLRRPVLRRGHAAPVADEQDGHRCPGRSPSATGARCRTPRSRPGAGRRRASPSRRRSSPSAPSSMAWPAPAATPPTWRPRPPEEAAPARA